MHRFFCKDAQIKDDRITITDKEQVHHIRDVLRLERGEPLAIFDDRGNTYSCLIDRISNNITLHIGEKKSHNTKNKIKISVACAIPKHSKFEDIVDKLTQLGVDRIIPLKTERLIVKLDKDKIASRLLRWKKIALNASQQSQRNRLPLIERVKDISEVLSEARDFDLKLIPTLAGQRKSLQEVFTNSHPNNVLILIGPEGDFTPDEVRLAIENGFIPVTLGDLVLRVETAAVAVAAFMRLYEDS